MTDAERIQQLEAKLAEAQAARADDLIKLMNDLDYLKTRVAELEAANE